MHTSYFILYITQQSVSFYAEYYEWNISMYLHYNHSRNAIEGIAEET